VCILLLEKVNLISLIKEKTGNTDNTKNKQNMLDLYKEMENFKEEDIIEIETDEEYIVESTEESTEESTVEEESTDSEEDDLSSVESTNYELTDKTFLFYNETEEIKKETDAFNYHLLKNSGNWLIAKTIVSYSKENTEFFWDYLDLLFKKNDTPDSFDNINKVIYSSNESVFEFDTVISKYIVDNLKISKYKPNGYIFNNNDSNNNIWAFTIIVITSKNIYSANRYIDDTTLGCLY